MPGYFSKYLRKYNGRRNIVALTLRNTIIIGHILRFLLYHIFGTDICEQCGRIDSNDISPFCENNTYRICRRCGQTFVPLRW